MPVNATYQKADLISNEHRYQMLKLVCDKNEKFEVSKLEMENKRQLYTIETLRKFQEIYQDYEIAFLMGSDNLKQLHQWKKAEELVSNFKIYVLKRNQDNIDKIIQKNPFLNKNKKAFIKTQNIITTSLSSSFVREQIKNKKSIRYLTTDEVEQYIKENKLYQ